MTRFFVLFRNREVCGERTYANKVSKSIHVPTHKKCPRTRKQLAHEEINQAQGNKPSTREQPTHEEKQPTYEETTRVRRNSPSTKETTNARRKTTRERENNPRTRRVPPHEESTAVRGEYRRTREATPKQGRRLRGARRGDKEKGPTASLLARRTFCLSPYFRTERPKGGFSRG